MQLVVLGPTGGTGEQLVTQALAAGHHVTAVARRPAAVRTIDPQLRVVRGDVLDPPTLAGAFDGADAVVSAIGSHSGREPTYVYSQGMLNVRAGMAAAGVRRLVALSAVPVSPRREKSVVDRVVHPVLGLFFGASYDDLRRMEADLRAADGLDWTAVRPPRLLDGSALGSYRMAIEAQLPRAISITRADLAAALLAIIPDASTYGKWLTISA